MVKLIPTSRRAVLLMLASILTVGGCAPNPDLSKAYYPGHTPGGGVVPQNYVRPNATQAVAQPMSIEQQIQQSRHKGQ